MPSENQLSLWWSGPSNSTFLYYLTGTMAISFLASIIITRSLRRMEPRVFGLLHEDNGSDLFFTYLVKITTSVLPGSGCPKSSKVFLKLKQDDKNYEFYQLKSTSCGRLIFQRGHTDIFIIKVPNRLRNMQSIELLVSGLNGDLTWKINNAQLYNPVSRENKIVPVKISSLEVLDVNSYSTINSNTTSLRLWVARSLLKYHQWLAAFGNTVRIGAFTEIIHVLCLFLTLFGLLIASQIFYISLPRGVYIPEVDEDGDIDGLFNINVQSLLLSSILSSVICTVLILGVELMLRNVKSWEKNPGNAYFTLCNDDCVKWQHTVESESYRFPYYPEAYFLPHCEDVCEKSSTNLVAADDNDGNGDDDESKKHLPQYMEYFMPYIKNCYQTYIQEIEAKSQDYSLHDDDDDGRNDESSGSCGIGPPITANTSGRKHSEQTVHKIELNSAINIDRLMSTTSLDHSNLPRKPRTTHMFGTIEDDADLNQVVIDVPDYDNHDINIWLEDNDLSFLFDEDTNSQRTDSNNSARADGNLNKSKNALVNQDENSKEFLNGNKPESFYGEPNKLKLKETISKAWQEECILSIPTSSDKTRNDDRLASLKTWSRELVTDLCEIIKSIREMVQRDKLDIGEITLMLLNKSQDVLQQVLMSCYLQCDPHLYDILGSDETCHLLTHLSMEIMITSFIEIFTMLMKRDHVQLVDLILRSHNIMHMIQYTAQLVLYVLQHQQDVLIYVRCLILSNDMHQLLTVTLHGCFDLVTKYNLVPWNNIEALVERDVKSNLEETCYQDMIKYIHEKDDSDKLEDAIVTRLCKTAEELAKQEVMEEIMNERMLFTNILIKGEVIKALKSKVTKLKQQKYRFDVDNDLIPKPPKTRLEILAEKRHQHVDSTTDNVHGRLRHVDNDNTADDVSDIYVLGQSAKQSSHFSMRTHSKREKLEQSVKQSSHSNIRTDSKNVEKLKEQSKQMGLYIENLSTICKRFRKYIILEGLSKKMDGSLLLAQASLQCLVIKDEDSETRKISVKDEIFTFDNFLQFKRIEKTLASFFQMIANELIQFLLTSVGSQYNLNCLSEVDIEDIVFDILVKLDSVVETIYEDIDNIVIRCMKSEHYLDKLYQLESISSEAQIAAANLIGKSSMMKWSTLDLSADKQGPSSYIDDRMMRPDDNISNSATNNNTEHVKVMDDNSTDLDKDINTTDKGHIDSKNKVLETSTYVEEIIKDLQPVKKILELLKQEESVRSEVTLKRYYKKCQLAREVHCRSQLNYIIDKYDVAHDGEEPLTSAGLYQLEHDCMYEDKKPLPPIVKKLTAAFIVLLLILITLYVTIIGGQFSITDLQEWTCYYMLSIVLYGFLLEPFRACVVGLYMETLEDKLHRKVLHQSKNTVNC